MFTGVQAIDELVRLCSFAWQAHSLDFTQVAV